MKKIAFIIWLFGLILFPVSINAQWEAIHGPLSGTFADGVFVAMSFVNDSTGFAVQNKIIKPGISLNYVLKTTDYGISWDTIYTYTNELAPLSTVHDIFFIDEQIGWMCGSGMPFILKTIDGGGTWNSYPVEGDDAFYRIEFADENFGIAFNGFIGTVAIETFDGGLTWNTNALHNGLDASFVDACNYVTLRSNAIRAFDDCAPSIIDFPTTNENPGRDGRCIYMKNSNEWVMGSIGLIGANNFGSILTTNDGGLSYTILDINSASWIPNLYFLNSNVGFATVSTSSDEMCTLFKTNDGGIVWNCQLTPFEYNQLLEVEYFSLFYDMELRNENLMYAMSEKTIYRTTNGGGPLSDTYTGIKVTPNKTKTLTLYPNPSSSVVRIDVSDAQDVREVSVYNSTGQLIQHSNASPQELLVAQWARGCYTVVVRYDHEVVRAQVIVE